MTNSKRHRARIARRALAIEKPQPRKATFGQQEKHSGLLVTDELDKALQECNSRVEEIAKDCRAKNRKFRDIEFDLENDKDRCLHGLAGAMFAPSDVQRVTQIFDKPKFFIDGANSNDIVQGAIGDCWFCSALSTMSTAKGLVERFCVARDEQVGVYGFIFFRDNKWVVIVIDDMLYTSIPKFEELRLDEKLLYHNDKSVYNKSARKGGKGLYFARSGTNGETWVPLIEKAYAKLHGSYRALHGGEACEAIEDLTGGVSSFISSKDILDTDKFWKEELLRANKDRLFGCAFDSLDSTRSGDPGAKVNGLIGGHAYSVLRAVEYKGMRFVVIRNPWGNSEWTGPWSDGSKEWTAETIPALEVLGHAFGDDGQFVMEYQDFLDNWDQIDRVRLFDSSWVMSSQWLRVTTRPALSAWTFGDVSYTITLPAPSLAVIVLSQLDDRFYQPISGRVSWSFDFVVFRKGEKKPISMSSYSRPYSRSVNVETYLEAGDYVVHVRLDRFYDHPENDLSTVMDGWQERTHSRVLTERAKSQSIASNFDKSEDAQYLPISLDTLAGQDLAELEAKAAAAAKALKKEQKTLTTADKDSDVKKKAKDMEKGEATTKGTKAEDTSAEGKPEINPEDAAHAEKITRIAGDDEDAESDESHQADDASRLSLSSDDGKPKLDSGSHDNKEDVGNKGEGNDDDNDNDGGSDDNDNDKSDSSINSQNVIFLGLRVYTNRGAAVVVNGQLRHEMATSFDGLSIDDR